MAAPTFSLDWIDAFVAKIRPYVFVRLTDRVLIRMPNQAFKLNHTGARVLHHILQGGSVGDFLKSRPMDHQLPGQLHSFFTDLSRVLSSAVCDGYRSPSLERIRFDLGYIELPVLSEVALTWRCNIKCRFCYAACTCVSESAGDSGLEELSTADVKRVLDIIRRDAEVPSVSFTGGEPTLRPDLIELIAYASGVLNMRVNLITNGTMIDERFSERLKAAGLASAQVSIESPDSGVHDAIVGVGNAFEASVNGLKALKTAGIICHPHATLCGLNVATLPGMARFAKSLGFERFSLNMLIPAGRGIDPELTISYSEIKEIVLKIKSEADKEGIRLLWYSPTPMCLFNPVSHQLGNKGCSACEGLLSVDPFGRVLPCSSWKEPLGHLLRDGFKAVWFGDKSRFLREKRSAHPDCRKCEHFAICHGACPLYFKVHGYGELEQALQKCRTVLHPNSGCQSGREVFLDSKRSPGERWRTVDQNRSALRNCPDQRSSQ
ncbi:MAG: radical SAM protein [Candidatus Aminicenantes bacterium]|nr:radical SAM protein [Candidatus Aminicenantes bacterium]